MSDDPPRQGSAPLVLLVDDELGILESVAELLRLEGFRVLTAADGAEALRVLSDEVPAVALVDVMMPGMNGLALVDALRADARYREVPVVLMTAATAVVPPVTSATCVVLAKPFHIDRVVEVLRRAIADRGSLER